MNLPMKAQRSVPFGRNSEMIVEVIKSIDIGSIVNRKTGTNSPHNQGCKVSHF